MKKSQKILKGFVALVMALAIFVSPFSDYLPIIGDGMKISAATMTSSEVQKKIDAMISGTYGSIYKAGSTFTKNGYYAKFTVTKNGVKQDHWNSHSYECMGFAKMVFEKIFEDKGTAATQITYTGSFSDVDAMVDWVKKNALPGDYMRYGDGGKGGHSLIIYSISDTGMKVYDANAYNTKGANGSKINNLIQFRDQKWGSTIQDGTFKYRFDGSTSLYLIRHSSSTAALDITTPPNDLGDQFLAAIQTSDGKKALTVDSNGNVSIQKYVGTANQNWMFTKTSGNYYEIKNPATGKCLDVSNGGNKNNANIQVWKDNDTSSQRFGIYGSQGNYALKVKYSTTHVVDAGGGNNNVHLWEYASNIQAQKFTIFYLFDNVNVNSITATNAVVGAKFYKPSDAKAETYGIVIGAGNDINNSLKRKVFSFKASTPNVGKTYRDITYDFVGEYNYSLSENTAYKYYMYAVYNIDGTKVTYTSPIYSFKTKTNVTIKNTTSKNTITGTNAIIWAQVDKPKSYPVTKIGIRVRVDGDTYDNGWSKYDNASKTYTDSTYMYIFYDMNKELNLKLARNTTYCYQFYTVVNGKTYWGTEGKFTTN